MFYYKFSKNIFLFRIYVKTFHEEGKIKVADNLITHGMGLLAYEYQSSRFIHLKIKGK